MTEPISKPFGISGFTLKCIAMLTMLIDHTGMALFPQLLWMRGIGRLAFPIYCFLLVEGALHTSNRKRYLGRLFLFALISEIPFDLVRTGKPWDMGAQNVFFTLFLGLLAVFILEEMRQKAYSAFLIAAIICIAQYGAADYGGGGVLIILCFYVFYSRKALKSAAFGAVDLFCYGISLQALAVLSLIPILCYNGKRGFRLKYFFYLFYPVHLLVLYWLRFLG